MKKEKCIRCELNQEILDSCDWIDIEEVCYEIEKFGGVADLLIKEEMNIYKILSVLCKYLMIKLSDPDFKGAS